MKKAFIFLLILNVNNLIQAQQKKILVQYESVRNNINNIETLIANNQSALFFSDSLFIENDNNLKKVNDDFGNSKYSISQKKIRIDSKKFYINRDDNVIFFTEQFKDKKSLVKDVLPIVNWNFDYIETKKIGVYICKKATTVFRGSQIEAWYAEELNVPFGPWKFKGLPGLILEVYNINSQSVEHWIAKRIEFPYVKDVSFTYNKKLPLISLKDTVDEDTAFINEQIKLMEARAPKGTISRTSKISREGIEQVFEWEK